jgi:hypothetical protein
MFPSTTKVEYKVSRPPYNKPNCSTKISTLSMSFPLTMEQFIQVIILPEMPKHWGWFQSHWEQFLYNREYIIYVTFYDINCMDKVGFNVLKLELNLEIV